MLNLFGFNKKKGEGEEAGAVDGESLEMIKNIHDLKNTTSKEIMVPRIDVQCVKIGTGLRDVIKMFKEAGYSRLPVYEKTVDDIVGILYLKDLFNFVLEGINPDEEVLTLEVLKKAYFIPETKKINVLLKEFQRKKIHMSVVVDEYGGFSGIVTMEDILEEIVGEIQDEYDDEEEDIIELGSGSFNCDARCDLEELNSRLKINLSTESVDTLGGFVYNLFGEIPKINQAASFENVNFKVLAMEKNTIERILVKVDYSTSEGDNGYNTD